MVRWHARLCLDAKGLDPVTAMPRSARPPDSLGPTATSPPRLLAPGDSALSKATGSSNIALGVNAGTNVAAGNNGDIASAGVSGDAATTRIGTTGTRRRRSWRASTASPLRPDAARGRHVNASGQLGTATASTAAALNASIQPLGTTANQVLGLRRRIAALQSLNRREQVQIDWLIRHVRGR
jgi:hypothetical protein